MNETTIQKAASTFGTPFYLFDESAFIARFDELKGAFPGMELCYAVKANPFLTASAARKAARLELCSPGEVRIALAAGVPEEKYVISGVHKSPERMEEMIRDHPGVALYTVESASQLTLLRTLAERHARTLRVLIRVSAGNQFGVDAAEIPALLAACGAALDPVGLQFYSGTQKFSVKKIAREIETLDALFLSLREKGFALPELEFGPGFPVCHFTDQTDFDEPAYFAEVRALLEKMKSRPAITLELGRSLAAGCGAYTVRVTDQKTNHGAHFAITDGGSHQIAYYGQMMAMKTPYITALPARNGEKKPWNLCGSLCNAGDLMVKGWNASLETGDLLTFHNAGAYCVTEGIALFLSRDLPAALAWDGEDFRLLRDHRETYEFNTERKH